MEPQENKQLALQKAINSHEQAAAGLNDLMGTLPEARYRAMLARIEENVSELQAELAGSGPGDRV
jgi:exonuclease VII small subunit